MYCCMYVYMIVYVHTYTIDVPSMAVGLVEEEEEELVSLLHPECANMPLAQVTIERMCVFWRILLREQLSDCIFWFALKDESPQR